jgi:hypothetical protein
MTIFNSKLFNYQRVHGFFQFSSAVLTTDGNITSKHADMTKAYQGWNCSVGSRMFCLRSWHLFIIIYIHIIIVYIYIYWFIYWKELNMLKPRFRKMASCKWTIIFRSQLTATVARKWSWSSSSPRRAMPGCQHRHWWYTVYIQYVYNYLQYNTPTCSHTYIHTHIYMYIHTIGSSPTRWNK